MTELDPHGELPLYQQLAAVLRAAIASGEIPPGRPIPSRKTLTQRYGVSVGTVVAAVDLLRADGLLVMRPGRGLYVRPGGDGG